MPEILWMEYMSAARLEEQNKKLLELAGWEGGMGFDQIDSDFCAEYLCEDEAAEYYFEENPRGRTD